MMIMTFEEEGVGGWGNLLWMFPSILAEVAAAR